MDPYTDIRVTLASPPGHQGMLAELAVNPDPTTIAHFADIFHGEGLVLRLWQNGDDERFDVSLPAFLDAVSLALARLGVDSASTAENYLRDLGYLLGEMALEAKREYEAAKGAGDASDRDYKAGYLMGFYRVISLMQQQASGFQMPLELMSMTSIDPTAICSSRVGLR